MLRSTMPINNRMQDPSSWRTTLGFTDVETVDAEDIRFRYEAMLLVEPNLEVRDRIHQAYEAARYELLSTASAGSNDAMRR